jgi:hypothetical protein
LALIAIDVGAIASVGLLAVTDPAVSAIVMTVNDAPTGYVKVGLNRRYLGRTTRQRH